LVEPHAVRFRGCRLADAEIQGMEVTVRAIDEPGHVAVRADVRGKVRLRHEHQLMRITEPLPALDLGPEVVDVAAVEGEVDVAELQVALDAVALDALEHEVAALDAHLPGNGRRLAAQATLDLVRVDEAVDELAAVATGRAPAHLLRLEHDDVVAAL